jgi:hypothetical protein
MQTLPKNDGDGHWSPALEDAPVGKLIHLVQDSNVPLAIRLGILKELTWRAQEITSYMPQTVEVLLRVRMLEGGVR